MKLDDFFPYVLPEVMGCPDPVLRNAVRMSVIEFCNASQAWSVISDPLALEEGVQDYEIETPVGAYAQTVRDVWMGSTRLQAITMAALQEVLPNWQTAQGSEPIYYNQAQERGSIRVFPIPTNVHGQELVMRVVFQPTLTTNTVPDWLGQDQMETIAAGAKYRLLLIPGQAWSNPNLGAYYKSQFDNSVTNARIEEAHERVPGSITVSPRSFGY